MKKLLLILLCFPMIGFAQDGVTYISRGNQGVLYYDNGNPRLKVRDTILNRRLRCELREKFWFPDGGRLESQIISIKNKPLEFKVSKTSYHHNGIIRQIETYSSCKGLVEHQKFTYLEKTSYYKNGKLNKLLVYQTPNHCGPLRTSKSVTYWTGKAAGQKGPSKLKYLVKNETCGYYNFDDQQLIYELNISEAGIILFENGRYHNEKSFMINGKDIRKVNRYNLDDFIKIFLKDCEENNIIIPNQRIDATFEALPEPIIALAYGKDENNFINIKVDPVNWEKASIEKKWYIIYHELGHDVLNLLHGQGGKMMYNFVDRDYTWSEFISDKNFMFKYYKEK